MPLAEFLHGFDLDDSLVRKLEFNPYYCHLQSGLGDPIKVGSEDYINLAANNYLGLADDPRVKQSIIRAVEKYGASLCGTPIAVGSTDQFAHLEQRLATWLGLEDAILLPSGYQANQGLFAAIAGPEDVICIDHYAHSSLVQGVKSTGCKIRPFLHNDLNHLANLLSKLKTYRQVFVVTESVFSTEGSIAPWQAMVEVCRHYQALPIIDDSHGIGVIGASGKGILEHAGLTAYPGLYTASLGKAIANAGGVIAGPHLLIQNLRYYCPQLIYSTALTPGVLAGIQAVLDILDQEFEILGKRMWDYKRRIQKSLWAAGFELAPGEAPINSIVAGSLEDTFRLAKYFFENKILTTPFVYPSVPKNEGRLRLIAGANLKPDTLIKVEETIRRWPRESA